MEHWAKMGYLQSDLIYVFSINLFNDRSRYFDVQRLFEPLRLLEEIRYASQNMLCQNVNS